MNVGMPKRQRKNYGVKQHLRDNESEDKRKMTKAELEDWSTCTKSPQTVETFLREKSEDDDEDDPLLEDFYRRLSSMIVQMHNHVEFYNSCYLEHYRWEHRAPEKDVPSDRIEFDRGHRLVLCIKDVLGAWQDWIYLSKSQFGGLGVFTAREFPKGGLLGLYMGPEVWQADAVGTPAPSAELLELHGVPDHVCNCAIRNAEGRMVVYCPQRVEPTNDPRPLYLGTHYIKGSEEQGIPSERVNCEIVDDGKVFAYRPLKPDEELISGLLS